MVPTEVWSLGIRHVATAARGSGRSKLATDDNQLPTHTGMRVCTHPDAG